MSSSSSPPPSASPPANGTATAPPPAPPSNTSSPSPPAPAPPSTPTPTPTPAPPSLPPPGAPAAPATPSTPTNTPARGTPASATASSPPSSSGLTAPVVVAIAVGGLVLLVLGSVLCVCMLRRKKKRHHHHPPPHHLHYYGHPPPPPPPPPPHKGDQYQNWQHNAPPPPPDHVVKMHSHLSPPPPPLNVHSSGSASNHSGGESRPPLSPGTVLNFSRSTFTYEQLMAATNGFSDANLLGQGGFGFVHKGVLPNGTEVAVKQLRDGSGQGEREFQAEVEIISRVHHKHLVSLVGYCISGVNRLLVYEFVPNNTLEFHLHGRGRPTLDWSTRLKIALGSAKGLAYLHEDCHPKIIHRDIKASNILLDLRFEAKVVRALEGDVSLDDLNEGVRPGHSRFMGSYSSSTSDYDTNQYKDDLKKFRKMAFGSSSVQSGSQQTPTTSEHGQNPSASGSDGHETTTTQETEMGSVRKDGGRAGDSQSQAS